MLERTESIDASGGRDLMFRAVLFSMLFVYVGFILAVLLADVLWLGRSDPLSGKPYLLKLANDTQVWQETKTAFYLSIVSALVTSVLAMIAGIPSAYALSRYRVPFARFVDTIIDLPIVIPPLIAGISLLVFFNQTSLGTRLNDLFDVVYTRRGIVVAQFFVASAFCIRALKATFDQINPRFEMVARSLGCRPFKTFWSITLPLAKTGLMAGWIMTWARALGEFAPIMVFAGATPGRDGTAVLPVDAFLNLSAGHIEAAVAITVLMIVMATITLITFKKLGGRGYLW